MKITEESKAGAAGKPTALEYCYLIFEYLPELTFRERATIISAASKEDLGYRLVDSPRCPLVEIKKGGNSRG